MEDGRSYARGRWRRVIAGGAAGAALALGLVLLAALGCAGEWLEEGRALVLTRAAPAAGALAAVLLSRGLGLPSAGLALGLTGALSLLPGACLAGEDAGAGLLWSLLCLLAGGAAGWLLPSRRVPSRRRRRRAAGRR